MYVNLSFDFDGRLCEFERVKSVTVQDYVFNGKMNVESALVVDNTAYELANISDIRMSVHAGFEHPRR